MTPTQNEDKVFDIMFLACFLLVVAPNITTIQGDIAPEKQKLKRVWKGINKQYKVDRMPAYRYMHISLFVLASAYLWTRSTTTSIEATAFVLLAIVLIDLLL